jgi:hypothetical protein
MSLNFSELYGDTGESCEGKTPNEIVTTVPGRRQCIVTRCGTSRDEEDTHIEDTKIIGTVMYCATLQFHPADLLLLPAPRCSGCSVSLCVTVGGVRRGWGLESVCVGGGRGAGLECVCVCVCWRGDGGGEGGSVVLCLSVRLSVCLNV